jgi:hypothetical protein
MRLPDSDGEMATATIELPIDMNQKRGSVRDRIAGSKGLMLEKISSF